MVDTCGNKTLVEEFVERGIREMVTQYQNCESQWGLSGKSCKWTYISQTFYLLMFQISTDLT